MIQVIVLKKGQEIKDPVNELTANQYQEIVGWFTDIKGERPNFAPNREVVVKVFRDDQELTYPLRELSNAEYEEVVEWYRALCSQLPSSKVAYERAS